MNESNQAAASQDNIEMSSLLLGAGFALASLIILPALAQRVGLGSSLTIALRGALMRASLIRHNTRRHSADCGGCDARVFISGTAVRSVDVQTADPADITHKSWTGQPTSMTSSCHVFSGLAAPKIPFQPAQIGVRQYVAFQLQVFCRIIQSYTVWQHIGRSVQVHHVAFNRL